MDTMESMTMPMSMSMSMSTATPTATSSGNPLTTGPAGGGMEELMMHTSGCKITMLWNWNTIDTCFLSTSWRIRSQGGFAALCLGVIAMVLLLEFLRRLGKMYDQRLVQEHSHIVQAIARAEFVSSGLKKSIEAESAAHASYSQATLLSRENDHGSGNSNSNNNGSNNSQQPLLVTTPFRPNIYQQAVRALIHTTQFALAYLIMLLAMYYNGYVLICIFLGAFIGAFIFQWERLGVVSGTGGAPGESHANEVTGCCG